MAHPQCSQPPPASVGPGGMPFIVQQQPAQIPFNRRWHIAKIAIRGWSALIAVLVIILDIVLAVKAEQLLRESASTSSGSYYTSYDMAFSLWISSLPPAVLVLLWDCAEFITLCVRRSSSGRGIHPGAHVGLDLILWMSMVIVWGILTAVVSFMPQYDWDSDLDAYVQDETYDPSVRAMAMAIIVFLVLLSIIHFFLFVRACVETDQRNRMMRHGGPIMVMPAPGQQSRPYYSLNTQPMWFQPAPTKKSRKHMEPQILQPMMGPPSNIQTPPQAYGGYFAPPSPQPAQQRHPQSPEASSEFAGYYAPQA